MNKSFESKRAAEPMGRVRARETRLETMGKIFAMILLSIIPVCQAKTETAASVEVRFCPASSIHIYPLESHRDIQSLLLQNIAVINHGSAPLKISTIELELRRADQVLDSRKLDAQAIERLADRGAKMQAAGSLQLVKFQFCGADLISPGVKLSGPTLNRDQALLITQQAFAFQGSRDNLRVHVHGNLGSRETEVSGSLPIKSEFAKNKFMFPLRGVWFVGTGASFHTAHRWAIPEEFAFDISKFGGDGLSHKGTGTRFEDYYAYGADVLAAGDGRVVGAVDNEAEDPAAMQQPDESQEAYFARLQKDQASRLSKGTSAIAGNYVMIDHGQNEYSLYAHLQPGSVRVHVDEQVKAGDAIGKLGSSGNSTEPHLHFHVCDKPDPLMCAGIPVNFANVTILWADLPRPIQSGDVVITK